MLQDLLGCDRCCMEHNSNAAGIQPNDFDMFQYIFFDVANGRFECCICCICMFRVLYLDVSVEVFVRVFLSSYRQALAPGSDWTSRR